MLKLNPIHLIVAQQLAKGIKLTDICKQMDLSYSTWANIATQPLFKHKVEQLTQELLNADKEDFIEDPVRRRIQDSRLKATERIIDEIDGTDPELGQSANTRLRAAHNILELSGDLVKEEISRSPQLVINISKSVLEEVEADARKPPIEVPPDIIEEGDQGVELDKLLEAVS
jgi:hypothetical protein